jgi:cobyrinic acid a,c-diamide synthase
VNKFAGVLGWRQRLLVISGENVGRSVAAECKGFATEGRRIILVGVARGEQIWESREPIPKK